MYTINGEVSIVETTMNAFNFGVTFAVAILCVFIIGCTAANGVSERSAKSHWIHKRKVSRFGGIAILLGLIVLVFAPHPKPFDTARALLVSSIPLVLTGFSEDFGLEIKPSLRIIAGFVSGFFAVFLTGFWITRIEVPYFDLILAIPIIAIPLSAFASTTIAHSFNLVDGLNGLCSGLSILAFLFFGSLALICGDAEMLKIMILIASCVLGFWLVNVTTGKIFLGDAGAYFLGHTAAWAAIVLASRHSIISPWALFLGLIYPISETLITIARRRLAGTPISTPDKKHLHHLVYLWILKVFGLSEKFANGTTGVLILLWSAVPATIAFYNYKFSITCFLVAVAYFTANTILYKLLQSTLTMRPTP